jgi:phosphate transport system substrate-binding protein
MKTSVAGDPCAIGYVSAGHIDSTVAAVSVDGTEPSKDNILSGKYSVARGLYSSTKGEPKGLVKKFLDYLFTADGKALIAEKGFIPVQ